MRFIYSDSYYSQVAKIEEQIAGRIEWIKAGLSFKETPTSQVIPIDPKILTKAILENEEIKGLYKLMTDLTAASMPIGLEADNVSRSEL